MDIVIMKKLLTFLLIYLLPNSSLWTADTCSRVAVVNYQEVLVDTNATQKGDGLRYYLEKDLEAKSYLELYQEGNRTRLSNTVIGTLATSMMFSSFFVDKSSPGREALLIGGFSVMVLNFLMAKTLEHKNEGNLDFFKAEDGIRDWSVTGVQTCALPIYQRLARQETADAAAVAVRCRAKRPVEAAEEPAEDPIHGPCQPVLGRMVIL